MPCITSLFAAAGLAALLLVGSTATAHAAAATSAGSGVIGWDSVGASAPAGQNVIGWD
ncbi:hypothetical protein [Streptomyces yangpuensis]|uniref:hypothetical protein n=1 Tax=Streptomyces yangpuensis TaxID=1648182 RepID=UPI00371A5964